MKNNEQNKNLLKDFIPIGKKDCQGICQRETIMTNQGPVLVCQGCKRIVIDNRLKK